MSMRRCHIKYKTLRESPELLCTWRLPWWLVLLCATPCREQACPFDIASEPSTVLLNELLFAKVIKAQGKSKLTKYQGIFSNIFPPRTVSVPAPGLLSFSGHCDHCHQMNSWNMRTSASLWKSLTPQLPDKLLGHVCLQVYSGLKTRLHWLRVLSMAQCGVCALDASQDAKRWADLLSLKPS